jgi:hypothetical protein
VVGFETVRIAAVQATPVILDAEAADAEVLNRYMGFSDRLDAEDRGLEPSYIVTKLVWSNAFKGGG